jgi:hypothetical protein
VQPPCPGRQVYSYGRLRYLLWDKHQKYQIRIQKSMRCVWKNPLRKKARVKHSRSEFSRSEFI